MSDESDEIKLGDMVDGQTLVAVGIDFTFTEIITSHQAAFKALDEWLTGIRTYDLEDSFDTDAILWDELEDCGYEIGEEDIVEETKKIKLYEVWVECLALGRSRAVVVCHMWGLRRGTAVRMSCTMRSTISSDRVQVGAPDSGECSTSQI